MHKKIITFLSIFLISPVHASLLTGGTLHINGAIVESACTIDPDNVYQTIDLGTVTIKSRSNAENAQPYPFTIKLINCVIKNSSGKDNKTVEVTFSANESYSSEDTAKNKLDIVIRDANSHKVNMNKASPPATITPGVMLMKYYLYLVGSPDRLVAGDYHTSLNIVLTYR